jgi:hypothetical protein
VILRIGQRPAASAASAAIFDPLAGDEFNLTV